MGYSVLPHYFIGVFMYSNQTILTSQIYGESILDYINFDN